MERISEKDLVRMAEWLTETFRQSGRITDGEHVTLTTPWIHRVWCVREIATGGVRPLDGIGGTRRELWNAGRAMLWAVRGY
jgi:hypothetical protein